MRLSLTQFLFLGLFTFFFFWFNPKYLTHIIRLLKKIKKRSE